MKAKTSVGWMDLLFSLREILEAGKRMFPVLNHDVPIGREGWLLLHEGLIIDR